jgi:hypothetical protein
MSSTRAVAATLVTLVMPGEAGGVVSGGAGGWVLGDSGVAEGIGLPSRSSRGCSHCPRASKPPTSTTTAAAVASTERCGIAKAVHLRAHCHTPRRIRRDNQRARFTPRTERRQGTYLFRSLVQRRFLSCEPLLGPIDLERAICQQPAPAYGQGFSRTTVHLSDCCRHALCAADLHWIIAGGESGPGHRPVDPAWVRFLRDQAAAAQVAFFFKQWGGPTPAAGGRLLDGRAWDQYPRGDRGEEPGW